MLRHGCVPSERKITMAKPVCQVVEIKGNDNWPMLFNQWRRSASYNNVCVNWTLFRRTGLWSDINYFSFPTMINWNVRVKPLSYMIQTGNNNKNGNSDNKPTLLNSVRKSHDMNILVLVVPKKRTGPWTILTMRSGHNFPFVLLVFVTLNTSKIIVYQIKRQVSIA